MTVRERVVTVRDEVGAGQALGRILVREITHDRGKIKHVKLVIEWRNPHTMEHTCEVYECRPGRMAHEED